MQKKKEFLNFSYSLLYNGNFQYFFWQKNGLGPLGVKCKYLAIYAIKVSKISSMNFYTSLGQEYSNCLKNKIVHNFFITNPNGMNQSFQYRQKYNL